MAGVSTFQEPVVQIPPGRYWIGDNSLPNAGPRHPLVFEKPVWIDRFPVRLVHLEHVVVRGGLQPATVAGASSFRSEAPNSVDCAIRSIFQVTEKTFARPAEKKLKPASFPACGLMWQEAADACRFFGARLPTEQEWEVAMGGRNLVSTKARTGDSLGTLSQLGCVGFLGQIQEWTGSAWTDRYWMDRDTHTVEPPDATTRISVRGCLPIGQVASLHGRLAVSRADAAVPRIFRRVWDHPPDPSFV